KLFNTNDVAGEEFFDAAKRLFEELGGIEQCCLWITHLYIGGSWKNAESREDITVSPIPGGSRHQLFKVTLNPSVTRAPDDGSRIKDEPMEVVVKQYWVARP